ncbi:hypothetical protein DYB26_008728, partial [Aphanomyces astaci]
MAEGLRIARAAETHESRRQDEFQKALTYLRDCYTQELDVARAQVTNEANEALHGEAEKNALSWEDRTRELERQLALKWEQREALLVRNKDSELLVARRLHEEVLFRSQKDAERVLEVRRREDHLRHDGLMPSLREVLRILKRNHQEEILLVREAARDDGNSKGSVQEALRAALRDLSFRESANSVCGNCPILEKEKQDLLEALRERERDLKEEVQRRQVWEEEHRCLLESEEMARELQESILTEQNRYEQTLLSERGRRQNIEQLAQDQFMTLSQERTQGKRCWLRQVEEARSCFETEKLQLLEQEATLFRERSVQDLTLSQAYAELERQRTQLQIEQRAVELQQSTLRKKNNVVRIFDDRLTSCGRISLLGGGWGGFPEGVHSEDTESKDGRNYGQLPPEVNGNLPGVCVVDRGASREAGLQANRAVVVMINGCSDAEVAACLRGASVRPETIEISLDYLIERDVDI